MSIAALAVALLIFLLIAGVCWWICNALISAFGIPDPLATVIKVVVILLLLLAFLGQVGVFGEPGLHFGRFC